MTNSNTIETDKKHTIRITFMPRNGLLTDFEVYSRDVPALIQALRRASGMETQEEINARMKANMEWLNKKKE